MAGRSAPIDENSIDIGQKEVTVEVTEAGEKNPQEPVSQGTVGIGDYVITSFFDNFVTFAQRFLEVIGPEGDEWTLHDVFPEGGNPDFERALATFAVLSRHSLNGLCNALIEWRAAKLTQMRATVKKEGPEKRDGSILRRGLSSSSISTTSPFEKQKLVLEYMFARCLLALLTSFRGRNLPEHVCVNIRQIVYEEIIGYSKKSTSTAAVKVNRELLVDSFCQILGTMSHHWYNPLTTSVMYEIETRLDSSDGRAEATSLCCILGHLNPEIDGQDELDDVSDLLKKVVTVLGRCKNAVFRHTLCSHLSRYLRNVWIRLVMSPVRVAHLDQSNLKSILQPLILKAQKWSKKNQHRSASLPLYVSMLCLCEQDPRNLIAVAELLLKLIKEKTEIKASLQCLAAVSYVYFQRLDEKGIAVDNKLSETICSSLFPPPKKSGPILADVKAETVEVLLVLAQRNLDFIMLKVILRFMSGDNIFSGNGQIAFEALRAILVHATQLEESGRNTWFPDAFSSDLPAKSFDRESICVFWCLKHSHLAPHMEAVGNCVRYLITSIDGLVGQNIVYQTRRPSTAEGPKDREVVAALAHTLLDALPAMAPKTMQVSELGHLLSKMAFNTCESIRQRASGALLRVLKITPASHLPCEAIVVSSGLQSNTIQSFVQYILRIPSHCVSDITRGLQLLESMLQHWIGMVSDGTPSVQAELLVDFSPSQIEAVAATLLCSFSGDVRLGAWHVLKHTQALARHHASLFDKTVTPPPPSSPFGINSPRSMDTPPRGPPRSHSPSEKCLMDVIDEFGTEIAKRSYGSDFELVDETQIVKPPPSLTMEDLAGASDSQEDQIRWARCLAEFVNLSMNYCSETLKIVWLEIRLGLQKLEPTSELSKKVLGNQFCLWRNSSIFVCAAACEPDQKESVAYEKLRLGADIVKDILDYIVSFLSSESEGPRATAVMALSRVNASLFPLLFDSIACLEEDVYNAEKRVKDKKKRLTNRSVLTHLFRLLAESMPPGATNNELTQLHFMRFLEDSIVYLASGDYSGPDIFLLRSNFCRFTCAVCQDVFATADDPAEVVTKETRYSAYSLIASWCNQDFATRKLKNRLKDALLEGVKDQSERDAISFNFEWQCRAVDIAGMGAVSALLLGRCFDAREEGGVFSLINSVLLCSDTRLRGLASASIESLLKTNNDLVHIAVKFCYDKDDKVSRAYFLVLVELLNTHEIFHHLHVLLNLALLKSGDASPTVRAAARHMIYTLTCRPDDNLSGAISNRNLFDTSGVPVCYQRVQCRLSESIMNEYPELSYAMLMEMFSRLQCLKVEDQKQLLRYSLPWLRALRLDDEKARAEYEALNALSPASAPAPDTSDQRDRDHSRDTLFSVMLSLSLEVQNTLEDEIEALWLELSKNHENAYRAIEYLLNEGAERLEEVFVLTPHGPFSKPRENDFFLPISTTIVIYLSRVDPSYAMNALVSEFDLKDHDDDDEAKGHASRRSNHRHHSPTHKDISPSPSSPGSTGTVSVEQLLLPPFCPEQPAGGRADVALLLLPDLVFEVGADMARPFTAQMVLSAVLCLDRESSVVVHHAKLLLANILKIYIVQFPSTFDSDAKRLCEQLLKSLSSPKDEGGKDEGDAWKRSDPRMWQQETVTLTHHNIPSEEKLRHFVSDYSSLLSFDNTLKTEMAELAFQWGVSCRCTHVASRSLQVFRALNHKLPDRRVLQLLGSLARWMAERDSESLGFVVELLVTLRHMVETLDSVILYPQVLWSSVALLHTDYNLLFSLALDVVAAVTDKLPWSQPITVDVLLASQPAAWSKSFLGLVPMVMKGLTSQATYERAFKLILFLTDMPSSVGPILDTKPQLHHQCMSAISLLLHIVTCLQHSYPDDVTVDAATKLTSSLKSIPKLSKVFSRLSKGAYSLSMTGLTSPSTKVSSPGTPPTLGISLPQSSLSLLHPPSPSFAEGGVGGGGNCTKTSAPPQLCHSPQKMSKGLENILVDLKKPLWQLIVPHLHDVLRFLGKMLARGPTVYHPAAMRLLILVLSSVPDDNAKKVRRNRTSLLSALGSGETDKLSPTHHSHHSHQRERHHHNHHQERGNLSPELLSSLFEVVSRHLSDPSTSQLALEVVDVMLYISEVNPDELLTGHKRKTPSDKSESHDFHSEEQGKVTFADQQTEEAPHPSHDKLRTSLVALKQLISESEEARRLSHTFASPLQQSPTWQHLGFEELIESTPRTFRSQLSSRSLTKGLSEAELKLNQLLSVYDTSPTDANQRLTPLPSPAPELSE